MMNYKQFTAAVIAVFLLGGCATESHKISAFDRINSQIKHSSDQVEIKEPYGYSDYVESGNQQDSPYDSAKDASSKSYQGNGQEDPTEPAFTAKKPTGPLYNANPYVAKRPQSTEKGNITLNFEGQDIRQVVSAVMTDLLKLNYTISPAVQGQVSLQTSRPISKADLLPLLETMLKENGHVMLKQDGIYRIMPLANAPQSTRPLVGKIKSQKPGYQVRIVPLKYVSAVEMQKRLAPYTPAGGLLEVDSARNSVTIAGTASELSRLQSIVETFDSDWMRGKAVGLYKFQNVKVNDVMPELQAIFGDGGGTPFSGMFQFIPMEKNNALMVVTVQESYLHEAKRWLERLDVNASSEAERLYVYRVQNGRAEHIAGVLSGIFAGGKDASAPASNNSDNNRDASVAPGLNLGSTGQANPEEATTQATKSQTPTVMRGRGTTITGAYATISADEENNSLVIKATPSNYDLVLQALRQIDVPKLQVMIEVVIAEVILTDSLQYGFKFWLQEQGKLKHGFSSNGPGAAQIGQTVDKDGKVVASSAVPGFNYTLSNVAGELNAQLTALQSKNMAKLISTPYMFVIDNQTASMNVGEKISVTTGKTNNNNGTVSSQEYIDTGVQINVTPRVNAGGVVRMDISQTISRSQANGSGNPNITNRSLESSVITQDGQTIALGGLIQRSSDVSRSGVPLVSDLPFIGSLFRGTTDNTARTELIVLITPHVSRNGSQTLEISRDFRAKMKGIDASQQIEAIPLNSK